MFTKKINIIFYEVGFFACLLLIGGLLLVRSISCMDIWWHLKTGETILELRRIPITDIFSFSVIGREWLNMSWGFEVLLYLLYSFTGTAGVLGYKFVTGMTCYLLSTLPFRKNNYKIWILITFIPFCSLFYLRSFARPELLSYVFFAILTALLLSKKDSFFYKKNITLILLLQLFWANLHGLYILGPILTGVFAVSVLLEKSLLKRKIPEWSTLFYYTRLPILQFIISGVTPHGLKGLVYPLELFSRLSGQYSVFDNIQEFRPLWSVDLSWQTSLSLMAMILFGMASVFFMAKRKYYSRACLLALALAFFVSAYRNMPFGLILCLGLSSEAAGIIVREGKWKKVLVSLGVVLLCFNAIVLISKVSDLKRNGFIAVQAPYKKACAFLKQQQIKGRFLNYSIGTGGAMIYDLWPDIKVFADGRLEVYDHEFLEQYIEMIRNPRLFDDIVDKYDIGGIFIDYTRRYKFIDISLQQAYERMIFRLYKSDQWRMVYFDETTVLFFRKGFSVGTQRLLLTEEEMRIREPSFKEGRNIKALLLMLKEYGLLKNIFYEKSPLEMTAEDQKEYIKLLIMADDMERLADVLPQLRVQTQTDDSPFFMLAEAYMYKNTGEFDKAEIVLMSIISKGSEDKVSTQAKLYLGDIARLKRDLLKAERFYYDVLQSGYAQEQSLNSLAGISFEMGNLDQAREYLQKLEEINPEHPALANKRFLQ